MSYSLHNNYLPQPQPSNYYSQPTHLAPLPSLHGPSTSPKPAVETNQRKRPKYTRSKTGCLTCRIKKVKCDETKPTCVRCLHGQRDCTWPEGVAPRKKPVSRKDSLEVDLRPSTAGSSNVSDGSTPPTLEHSPPHRSLDLPLLTYPSRRVQDPYAYSQSFKQDCDLPRSSIQLNQERISPYVYPPPSTDSLPALQHDTYHSRYDHHPTHNATNHHHSRQVMPNVYRSYTHHEPTNHWHTPANSLESSYYHPVSERTLLSHDSVHDSHHRYQ